MSDTIDSISGLYRVDCPECTGEPSLYINFCVRCSGDGWIWAIKNEKIPTS